MQKIKFRVVLPTFLVFALLANFLFGQNKNPFTNQAKTFRIYTFEIKEEIAPPILRMTQKSFEAARDTSADLIIIDMNTYGGMLESADSIRTIILESEIPVWVFINNNAASAGALISIACDSIYMRDGANIGAATVVNQTGEALPDKYQSYMRAMMRSTAEAKGRDPRIAEAMVDPRLEVPGISDSGQVITFTTSEAIKHGYCEGKAESLIDIIENAGIEKYELVKHRSTGLDNLIGFLISPIISGILIMVIIGGIYFELQTPGIGFPLGASVVAALLYFAPLYLEGLAANWEILIFIIGIVLIIIELFAIPGFGVAGISGVILVVAGLTLSMIDNMAFEQGEFPFSQLASAFFTVIIAAFVSLILSIYLSRKLLTTTRFGEIALATIQEKSEGYTFATRDYSTMIGREGFAKTILRPAGKILIDDKTYDATSESGFIEKGDRIIVVHYVNAQLFVRKV